MSINNKFSVKKLQRLDGFYTVFSSLTRMPYVSCDQETYDDLIYIFAAEEACRDFIKELEEQKRPGAMLKIPKHQMAGFFNSLHALDVNMVSFHDEAGEARIDAEDLSPRPDMEKIKASKIPLMNPQLTLTMIYFLQELRRPITRDTAHLRELEEEMVANLIKSHFILGVEAGQQDTDQKSEAVNTKNIRIPFMKSKEGDIYQPIYSDLAEFRKYAGPKAQSMRMLDLTLKQLPQFMVKNAKGFVINPASVNLVLTEDQLKRLL